MPNSQISKIKTPQRSRRTPRGTLIATLAVCGIIASCTKTDQGATPPPGKRAIARVPKENYKLISKNRSKNIEGDYYNKEFEAAYDHTGKEIYGSSRYGQMKAIEHTKRTQYKNSPGYQLKILKNSKNAPQARREVPEGRTSANKNIDSYKYAQFLGEDSGDSLEISTKPKSPALDLNIPGQEIMEKVQNSTLAELGNEWSVNKAKAHRKRDESPMRESLKSKILEIHGNQRTTPSRGRGGVDPNPTNRTRPASSKYQLSTSQSYSPSEAQKIASKLKKYGNVKIVTNKDQQSLILISPIGKYQSQSPRDTMNEIIRSEGVLDLGISD